MCMGALPCSDVLGSEKKHVLNLFESFLNNSEVCKLSFEDILLGTLDTHTKNINPPWAVLGDGVHGRVGVKYSTCIWYLYLSTYLSVLDVLE